MSIIESYINNILPNKKWATIDVQTYFEFFMNSEYEEIFKKAIKKWTKMFFHEDREDTSESWPEKDMSDSRFWDYFIFSYEDELFNWNTSFEFFINHANLNKEDKEYFQKMFDSNAYSAFRIIEVNEWTSFEARDLISGKAYEIKEYQWTFQMDIWNLLIWRILVDRNWDYRLSPWMATFFGKEMWIWFWNTVERFKSEWQKRWFDPTIVEQICFNKKTWNKKFDTNKEFSKENKDNTKNKLKDFLTKHDSSLSIDDITKMIYECKKWDETKLIPNVIQSFKSTLSTKESLDEFMDIWNEYYNLSSRKILKWKSPREIINDYPLWPIEDTLNKDLYVATSQIFNPSSFPTLKSCQACVERFQKQWFTTKQEALWWSTPEDVIMKERISLWVSLKDLRCRMNFENSWEEESEELQDKAFGTFP